ncbi:nicotinamide riboside transporter PnuC, partial [Streptococcus suis]
YFFGFISTLIYCVLSYPNMFYGEVITAIFFIVMQPVGLYFWLSARVNGASDEEKSEF